jgi:hypothetical protein
VKLLVFFVHPADDNSLPAEVLRLPYRNWRSYHNPELQSRDWNRTVDVIVADGEDAVVDTFSYQVIQRIYHHYCESGVDVSLRAWDPLTRVWVDLDEAPVAPFHEDIGLLDMWVRACARNLRGSPTRACDFGGVMGGP